MIDTHDFMQVMVREIRRDILRFLHVAGNFGVNERMLLTAMMTYKHNVLQGDIRRHLNYLEQRHVLKIKGRDQNVWTITITADGTDIVEGLQKCPDWMAPMVI